MDWQQVLVDFVEKHEDLVGQEEFQIMGEYGRNKETSIRISLPTGSGHTSAAAYLACNYPSLLIFTDIEHYKSLASAAKKFRDKNCSKAVNEFDFHPETVCLSFYHVYHDMLAISKSASQSHALNKLRNRVFSQPKDTAARCVVVDNATNVTELHPEILDWIYNIAEGPVVLLG
ncbi:MAG: hypothetical protein HC888_00280 [Candidatus Competibacteraceae bacterium]|nr:hypothetical protein [Candidatus Competibacteraceae bacterium]